MKRAQGYTGRRTLYLPISTVKYALPCSMLKSIVERRNFVNWSQNINETGVIPNKVLVDLIAHISVRIEMTKSSWVQGATQVA